MKMRTLARLVSSFGNVLIAASLLSALIWWRAGVYLFVAGALAFALSWVIRGGWGTASFPARE